jgi:hypothetical protein
MSARRVTRTSSTHWPEQLQLLFTAAEHECPPGHGVALHEFADRHLGMRRARTAWRRVVRQADLEPELREQIEQAAQQLQAVSDTAYFYTGLAFGLTSAFVYRAGP